MGASLPRGGDVVFDDEDEDEDRAVTRRGRARGARAELTQGTEEEEKVFADMARMKND